MSGESVRGKSCCPSSNFWPLHWSHCPHGEEVETQVLVASILGVIGVDSHTLRLGDQLAAGLPDKEFHEEVGVLYIQNVARNLGVLISE